MENRYLTVENPAEAEIVEKRSRFIATVKPVTVEADATAFLDELRQKYWNATHNVYAYVIRNNQIQRYSDDGEPSGTAGVPVLDCLKKEGLHDLIVVVTRYFGGVLLGTGGLVHAYSKAARAGIDAAGRLEMLRCRRIHIGCAYTELGKIEHEIRSWNHISEEIEYTDRVVLPVCIPVEDAERFCAAITEKTNGAAVLKQGEELYKSRKLIV